MALVLAAKRELGKRGIECSVKVAIALFECHGITMREEVPNYLIADRSVDF